MKPLPIADLELVFNHTHELWNRVRGKRIFLSGGTGFFGIWLLETLVHCNRALDLNISATVLCREPQRVCARYPNIARESCIHFVRGDIRNFEFPPEEHEFVIHAASPTAAAKLLIADDVLQTLIEGTRRVLTFAKFCGARKLLFVSSGAVYGPQPEVIHRIPEDYVGGPDWINPASAYAEGKRVSELLCSDSAYSLGIRVAIARCFAFVGPHLPLDRHFAIGNFISDALANRRILVRGDGSPIRSYLYTADLAIWLWTLLLSEPTPDINPVVINVGSSQALSIADVAREVAKALNRELKVDIAEKPTPGAQLLQYVPDVRRAESLYGLRQIIELQEGIRRTADWHRA
jgi:nucleoside-diphosphate-sugar epimerase